MKTLYCISGLGADERVFSKINLPGYNINFLKWLTPEKNETIARYARRMSAQITEANPVIIGLSFGGMIAIEISKQIPVNKIILVSSIKSAKELPRWMKLAGKLKLNKIFPLRSNRFTEPFQNYNLGVETKEEKQITREYRKNIDRKYLEWAVNEILNWKNETCDTPVFHIHGDKDRIFPVKNIKPDIIIPSAGHLMIMNKADLIATKIKEILEKS